MLNLISSTCKLAGSSSAAGKQGFRRTGGEGCLEGSEGRNDRTGTAREQLRIMVPRPSDAEARAYAGEDGHTSAWLWLGGGRVELVGITLDHMTTFDLNDYASQTRNVTGADGRVIVSARVRIDGRALQPVTTSRRNRSRSNARSN